MPQDDAGTDKRLELTERMQEQEREWADAIAREGAPTEKELRDAKVPWPNDEEELIKYIHSLVERPHDYGTCVYAMSMAAVAAYNYVAQELGVTGFQASMADLDILRRTRGWEWGKILDYDQLLYPQYCDDEHFPTWHWLVEEHAQELAKKAEAKLAESDGVAAPAVLHHWKWLIEKGKHDKAGAQQGQEEAF